MGATDSRDERLHEQADNLARRIEATLLEGRRVLEDMPTLQVGRSERAKQLESFLNQFGGS